MNADVLPFPEAAPSLLDGLKTFAWLDQAEFPPVSWIVPGLIAEGMSLLVGGPKLGKSWLSLDLALAVASGGRALAGIRVGQRPVLLLALEDGDRRLQGRARQLLPEGSRLPAGLDYLTQVAPGRAVEAIEEWVERLPAEAQPLVILDTLGKVMPQTLPGEGAYQRDYRVAGRLKRITDTRPGMALVILHHDRKMGSGDFVEAVSGTNGLAGAADSIIVLERQRQEKVGVLHVTGRDVDEAEYAVAFDDGAWSIAGGTLETAAAAAAEHRVTGGLGDQSGAVAKFVADHPEGVKASDVAEAVPEVTVVYARQVLKRLADSGRIVRTGRGAYAPPSSDEQHPEL